MKYLAPGTHLVGKRWAHPRHPGRGHQVGLAPWHCFSQDCSDQASHQRLARSALLTISQQDIWHCLDQRGSSRCRNRMTAETQMQNRHPTSPLASVSVYSKSRHSQRHVIVTTDPLKTTHTGKGRTQYRSIVLLDVRSHPNALPSEILHCFLMILKINK